ncbi:MAG: transcriptional regulator [Mesorhizobium sp.]|uniref:type II toxin-antitoxin system VapB family antitoxin n=1 Tax=Mesorhizobium sp. TaxID=1871066 RepID=UPI0012250689|nr:type II toxin-antitoxin system VapB family antitoxin [Mesorhizobium sp.]TIQ38088.1 MAG: transcriptional regulator [Mesorhizobium sp.]
MALHIKNPRARELARYLADSRKISLTKAVIEALQSELQREISRKPLAERLAQIAHDLSAKAAMQGRRMDKNEIDEMWGHS